MLLILLSPVEPVVALPERAGSAAADTLLAPEADAPADGDEDDAEDSTGVYMLSPDKLPSLADSTLTPPAVRSDSTLTPPAARPDSAGVLRPARPDSARAAAVRPARPVATPAVPPPRTGVLGLHPAALLVGLVVIHILVVRMIAD